ncbi:PHD finger protein EHD3-like isoform X2 [Actinidia eriantha]|uniref:PHD finger protein EHD3-like isoform X2 n=1 Tax=Actinidia eriantha TaxID=165200 RepID=UPI00258738EE|nr:PHD finger protein EHD3-like isoform X2 [Actinidia eriantha]
MVDEKRENDGGAAECDEGDVGTSGEAVNGFAVEIENGTVGDGSSAGSSGEGIRMYKRRKQTKMSNSETKLVEGRNVAAADSVSQLPEKTVQVPMDRDLHSCSCERVSYPGTGWHAVMSGLGDCSLNGWRNIVLEKLCQPLCESKRGLQECIQDALQSHPESGCRTAVKESFHSREEKDEGPSETGWMANGAHNVVKGDVGAMFDGSLSQSNRTNTDLCRQAFFDTIMSEKFAQLCCLLSENFQGIKVDNIIDISIINLRMKEGTYETSPMLFHSDMQQLWSKFQKIGAEMVTLAKNLSGKSNSSYREQFPTRESGLLAKPEQTEPCGVYKVCACRRCGEKADGRNCLVCDSCEEMYHVSCIEPAVEEIPSKSWYCAYCTANGIESPHDNCAVCEKLNSARPPNNGFGDDFLELEENSNGLENAVQHVDRCKVCGSEADNCEGLMVCGHSFCPHKYYHVRCLTNKQLSTYGRCWYCPSCLCRSCLTDRDDDKIVLCDGCDHAYHIYCMQPPRAAIPRGKWFCRKCDVGIRKIRKVKRAYENAQNKLKKRDEDGKGPFGNHQDAQEDKDEEFVDKSGGMDMLLTAAKTLNLEEKMAAVEMES